MAGKLPGVPHSSVVVPLGQWCKRPRRTRKAFCDLAWEATSTWRSASPTRLVWWEETYRWVNIGGKGTGASQGLPPRSPNLLGGVREVSVLHGQGLACKTRAVNPAGMAHWLSGDL